MLTRFARPAAGRLACQCITPCRDILRSSASRQRDAFVRYLNTATNPEDEPPRRRPGARWANQKDYPRSQKVTLDVDSLGRPGEIVVVPHRTRRRRNSVEIKRNTSDKSALPFMLEDIAIKDTVLESGTINENIRSFREPHRPHDKLSSNDWEDLRNRLQSSLPINSCQTIYKKRSKRR